MVCIEQCAGELFRTFPGLEWIADSPNRELSFYSDLIARGWCWVARDQQGEVKGFIAAQRIADDLHFCEMAVSRALQRQGIGRSLMQAAIASAQARGLERLTLTTFRDVPWNAPAYESFEFRRMNPKQIPRRLKRVLCAEVAAGLEIGSRCAMSLDLVSPGYGPNWSRAEPPTRGPS
jgi:GNAT superfamily N-acetyltransferase